MIKKNFLISCLLAFILGLTSMYIYKEQELKNNKDLTNKLIRACMDVETLNKLIYNSCNEQVNEILSCMGNKDCDFKDSVSKFGKLDKDINYLFKQKEKTADELLEYISMYK